MEKKGFPINSKILFNNYRLTIMEDAKATKMDSRSLFEDARLMMEDAWMTVETAGILMMSDDKSIPVKKKTLQDSILTLLM